MSSSRHQIIIYRAVLDGQQHHDLNLEYIICYDFAYIYVCPSNSSYRGVPIVFLPRRLQLSLAGSVVGVLVLRNACVSFAYACLRGGEETS